jgi:hypothetical protein
MSACRRAGRQVGIIYELRISIRYTPHRMILREGNYMYQIKN